MRSLVTIGGLLLALAPLLPALSQDLLFGRKAPQRPHVTWKVTVEPSTTTPGGRVEVVARYATLKSWHIYAPDHKGTGIASRISVRSEFLKAQGDPRFPQPETKEDKILEETHRLLSGKGEIRQTFVVSEKTPAGRLRFQTLLDYMSCDAQSCDPPKKGEPHSLTLEVAAASVGLAPAAGVAKPAAPAEGEKPGAAKKRGLLFPVGLMTPGAPGASRKKHAHFQVTVEPATLRRGQRAEIVVEYETTKGYYIYAPDQDVSQGGVRTVVLVESPEITLSGEPTFPAPKVKEIVGLTSRTLSSEDPGEHKIRQPFHVKPEAPPGELNFRVTVPFMTCFSGGCDLPDEHVEDLVVQVTDEEPIAVQARPAQGADEERIALGSIWLLILAMIGGGLLALVMPCTYPMIPITIGYFTNLAASRKGGVLHLALAYGAGIILSFNIIGCRGAQLSCGPTTPGLCPPPGTPTGTHLADRRHLSPDRAPSRPRNHPHLCTGRRATRLPLHRRLRPRRRRQSRFTT